MMPAFSEIAKLLPSLSSNLAFLVLFFWFYFKYFDRILSFMEIRLRLEYGQSDKKLSKKQFYNRAILLIGIVYTILGIFLIRLQSVIFNGKFSPLWVEITSWSIFGISCLVVWLYLYREAFKSQKISNKEIIGDVLWEKRHTPVMGALVQVLGQGYETRTNSNGHFEITVDRNSFKKGLSITVSFGTIVSTPLKINLKPMIVYLPETIKIRGNVLLDGSHLPVNETKVYIEGENQNPVITNEQGYFEINASIKEKYILRVFSKTESIQSTLDFSDVANSIQLILPNKASLRGNVYWEDSMMPVIGAVLSILGERGDWVANSQGFFEIPVNLSKKLEITVTASGAKHKTVILNLNESSIFERGTKILLQRDENNSLPNIKEISPSKKKTALITKEVDQGKTKSNNPFILGPGIKFLFIPEGEFIFGTSVEESNRLVSEEGQDFFSVEIPERIEMLPRFAISETPVTIGQYKVFIKDTGYIDPQFWDEEGLGWKKDRLAPKYWENKFWIQSDALPVIGITWYEANAFCKWFSTTNKCEVRLPTEFEWEKAARGIDGRKYPWGNFSPNNKLANYNNFIKHTTTVNRYTAGKSQFNVLDMAGNIWEWSKTDWLFDVSNSSVSKKVVKGGAFNSNDRFIRSAFKMGMEKSYSNNYLGFRCVFETL